MRHMTGDNHEREVRTGTSFRTVRQSPGVNADGNAHHHHEPTGKATTAGIHPGPTGRVPRPAGRRLRAGPLRRSARSHPNGSLRFCCILDSGTQPHRHTLGGQFTTLRMGFVLNRTSCIFFLLCDCIPVGVKKNHGSALELLRRHASGTRFDRGVAHCAQRSDSVGEDSGGGREHFETAVRHRLVRNAFLSVPHRTTRNARRVAGRRTATAAVVCPGGTVSAAALRTHPGRPLCMRHFAYDARAPALRLDAAHGFSERIRSVGRHSTPLAPVRGCGAAIDSETIANPVGDHRKPPWLRFSTRSVTEHSRLAFPNKPVSTGDLKMGASMLSPLQQEPAPGFAFAGVLLIDGITVEMGNK